MLGWVWCALWVYVCVSVLILCNGSDSCFVFYVLLCLVLSLFGFLFMVGLLRSCMVSDSLLGFCLLYGDFLVWVWLCLEVACVGLSELVCLNCCNSYDLVLLWVCYYFCACWYSEIRVFACLLFAYLV